MCPTAMPCGISGKLPSALVKFSTEVAFIAVWRNRGAELRGGRRVSGVLIALLTRKPLSGGWQSKIKIRIRSLSYQCRLETDEVRRR